MNKKNKTIKKQELIEFLEKRVKLCENMIEYSQNKEKWKCRKEAYDDILFELIF